MLGEATSAVPQDCEAGENLLCAVKEGKGVCDTRPREDCGSLVQETCDTVASESESCDEESYDSESDAGSSSEPDLYLPMFQPKKTEKREAVNECDHKPENLSEMVTTEGAKTSGGDVSAGEMQEEVECGSPGVVENEESDCSGDWAVYQSASEREDEGEESSPVQAVQIGGKAAKRPRASAPAEFKYERSKRNQIVRQPVQPTPKSIQKALRRTVGLVNKEVVRMRECVEMCAGGTPLAPQSVPVGQGPGGVSLHGESTRGEVWEMCASYMRLGKCTWKGECRYSHDPNLVAVCPRWLAGNCKAKKCKLQHRYVTDLIPTCVYHVSGGCWRLNCPYLHTDVAHNAPVCPQFLMGYCKKGAHCEKKHLTAKMVAEMEGDNAGGFMRQMSAQLLEDRIGVNMNMGGHPAKRTRIGMLC